MVDKDLIQTKGHDPRLLAAFEAMCRENSWRQADVLSYYIEKAVAENHSLAIHLYRYLKHREKHKWEPPESWD